MKIKYWIKRADRKILRKIYLLFLCTNIRNERSDDIGNKKFAYQCRYCYKVKRSKRNCKSFIQRKGYIKR